MMLSQELSTTASKGKIHSIESFGTVDGPGVRMVVFFQGCPMRCLYCHNPDTWNLNSEGSTEMSAEEILALYEKNRNFYDRGGLTVTGGEPLMQLDFLISLFTAAKKKDIHTCLDTSGILFQSCQQDKYAKLLAVTDLVMLDIKHIHPEQHQKMTGHKPDAVFQFLQFCEQHHQTVWIRHVVVPALSDDPKDLMDLGHYLSLFTCVKALDVLGYHTMGKAKYEQLHLQYPLADTPELSKEQARQARQWILKGIHEGRSQQKKRT